MTKQPENTDIWVLAGQSNMQGARQLSQALAMTGELGGSMGPRVKSIKSCRSLGNNLDNYAINVECSGVSGGWLPEDNIRGFGILSADGKPRIMCGLCNAYPHPDDPTTVHLLLGGPVEPGDSLVYGLGFDPFCNAVDHNDMPLCAFKEKI